MLTKILRWLGLGSKTQATYPTGHSPVIIPRSQHTLSRANISKSALKVLYRLRESGYAAFLVGGGVRDVLLGRHPKDFDVVTDASPEQVQKIFRNCRLIGRRFRLAHVHFGSHIVEVATFRAKHPEDSEGESHLAQSRDGMILRDNIYGTLEEDIWRRDFTVNALYYNIDDFTLLDSVGGLQDLKTKTLRMIGTATKRYREDPVRMLRAVRFAAKLGFHIHPDTEKPLIENVNLLTSVPSARLFDEYLKLFLGGHAVSGFRLLRQYGLLAVLFPGTATALTGQHKEQTATFMHHALNDTDKRVEENKPVAPSFLLSAFLWYPLLHEMKILLEQGLPEFAAFNEAGARIIQEQQKHMAIPRKLIQIIREIWTLQFRLVKRGGRRAAALYSHPRFRAAYDFLLLRAKAKEVEAEKLAKWWKIYTEADPETRLKMSDALGKDPSKRRRKSISKQDSSSQ